MLARVIAPGTISVYRRATTPAAAGLLPALAAPLSVRTPAIVSTPLLLIVVTCLDASVAAQVSDRSTALVAAIMLPAPSALGSGEAPTTATPQHTLRVLDCVVAPVATRGSDFADVPATITVLTALVSVSALAVESLRPGG